MEMGRLGTQLVEEMQSLANSRTIEINIVGDTAGAWDKDRIGQVFSNLISNALEYSFPDSTISVTVDGTQSDVVIAVHNKGDPIAPDKFATVFEALTRGQPSHADQRGSSHLGLGLYITKQIVVAHNGNMNVSSDNSGTTFTAHLPRK